MIWEANQWKRWERYQADHEGTEEEIDTVQEFYTTWKAQAYQCLLAEHANTTNWLHEVLLKLVEENGRREWITGFLNHIPQRGWIFDSFYDEHRHSMH